MVFRNPEAVITARTREDLPAAFTAIATAQRDGKWLAGSLAYELGHALEVKFDAPSPAPLIQLGVFTAPETQAPVDWLYTRDTLHLDFEPSWSEADYLSRFEQVQDYLRAGDCYQVNLTFPLLAQSPATPTQIYAAFRRRQPGRYGAVVDLGDVASVSFSPELFFERRGRDMRMRPMKGTRPRATKTGSDDATIIAQMQAEPKSRAENLMIVDLLRNDLSRLCEPGSVKVPELFALETYPTLHQMTSQVTGHLRDGVSWAEIFQGLFPCGSVTGAPKIRAMEIIQDLESGPRGLYCGSVGYIAPSGDASFSVAIRTIQMSKGQLRYDVGSGVVLDSEGPDEYRECLLKAKIFEPQGDGVIETFRRQANGTIPREELHIARLAASSAQSMSNIQSAFDDIKTTHPHEDLRVRVVAPTHPSDTVELNIETETFTPLNTPIKLALSRYPLSPQVQVTGMKTAARDFYDGERVRISHLTEAKEVIFLNARDEICEGSFTSIFIQRDDQLLTPPLTSGLLPGVLRQDLLAQGKAVEVRLGVEDLMTAEAIFIGNSLRGLMPATFIDFLQH